MQKQTPHSRMQDASNFVMVAFLLLIIAMALNSCASQRNNCKLTRGMVGYGSYR